MIFHVVSSFRPSRLFRRRVSPPSFRSLVKFLKMLSKNELKLSPVLRLPNERLVERIRLLTTFPFLIKKNFFHKLLKALTTCSSLKEISILLANDHKTSIMS